MDDRLQQRIAQLEAENSRLKRLIDGDGASGGPRRRMRETVSLLRVVIQRSADRATDVANYGAHLVDRLDALARAQAAADEEGRIGLHALIADQLLRYRLGEGERISLSGPAIDLCPHAGQIFALAIHELAVNAIEHGELAEAGTLAVTWDVGAAGLFTLDWVEGGGSGAASPARAGFGTDMLMHMLGAAFGAKTRLDWQADGLSCHVAFVWSDRIGALPVL